MGCCISAQRPTENLVQVQQTTISSQYKALRKQGSAGSNSSGQWTQRRQNRTQSSIRITRARFVTVVQQPIQTQYEILELLQEQDFFTIQRAQNKQTKINRIIKSITKRNSQMTYLFESDILRQFDHPHITKLIELFETQDVMHIVLEDYTQYDIFSRAKQIGDSSENYIASLMRQLISAVTYCHKAGIAHGDIRPENIVFASDSEDSGIKLINFSGALNIKTNMSLSPVVKKSYFLAPEALDGKYHEKSDVWSCGVILCMLLTGVYPFSGETDEEIFQSIRDCNYSFYKLEWKQVSRDAMYIVQKMLKVDLNLRVTSEMALRDSWIQHRANNMVIDHPIYLKTLENLARYKSGPQFKQAAFGYMASQILENKDISHIQDLFLSLDKNGDGKLNRSDIITGFLQLGLVSQENIDQVIEKLQFQSDGLFNYTEFLTATIDWSQAITKEHLNIVFNNISKDKNRISYHDITSFFKADDPTKRNTMKQAFDQIDSDRDGQIDVHDFIKGIITDQDFQETQ